MERAVKIEAGHRCAICQATSGLEIHHIDDYADVKEHTFENLILLCAICHSRVTKKEIDKLAVRTYKTNLSILAYRYGDLERRILDYFVHNDTATSVDIDWSHRLLIDYLVRDGLIRPSGVGEGALLLDIHPEGAGAAQTDSPAPDTSQFFEERNNLPGMGPNRTFFGPVKWELTDSGIEVVTRIREARSIE